MVQAASFSNRRQLYTNAKHTLWGSLHHPFGNEALFCSERKNRNRSSDRDQQPRGCRHGCHLAVAVAAALGRVRFSWARPPLDKK